MKPALGQIGSVVLMIWFFLYGFLAVTNITFQFANPLMGFLALAIGILVLIGK